MVLTESPVARFVFVTDTHYHPQAAHDFGAPKMLTHSREVLDATVPAVNSLRADFVVHGGDLLCGGESFEMPDDQYEQSLRDVAAAYAGFTAPIYYVPGNHDCDASQFSFDAFKRAFPIPETLEVVEAAPRVRLALANLYHSGRGGCGEWSDELDDALRHANAEARAVSAALVLVMHAWITPSFLSGEEGLEAGCVGNVERLRQTLSECPAVVAAFTGHRHTNRIRLLGDLVVIDTSCLIGYPFGFREIVLDGGGWMTCRFRQLDLPELMQESYDRSDVMTNERWCGEEGDRNAVVLLPRLRELWRPKNQ